nr:NTP transferase domain-containing protein [bacterium]
MLAKKKLSAIILAAGAGTRLRSEIPKALHEICGEPILVHLLRTTRGLVDAKT